MRLLLQTDPPEVARLLGSFTGRLAFDVGANAGQSSMLMSPHFDAVVAVEPAVESFAVLSHASMWNVMCVNKAASDHDGSVTLAVQERHIGSGQLTSFDADEHGAGAVVGQRVVEAVTLDTLADQFGFPDFVKCDVEGHEVAVFAGATQVLERAPGLFIEVHSAAAGPALTALVGRPLRRVEHPYYMDGTWGRANHYWLVAGG